MIRPVIFVRATAVVLAACLAACAVFEIHKEPVNQPLAGNAAAALAAGSDNTSGSDDIMIGLAFSGGGTRAAAFSFGALSEIERTRLPDRGGTGSLLDRVNFVSGVSGGSVLTAYYGLKKRAALADFRERFLLRNAEESLTTNVSPLSVVRAVAGGVNDTGQFARWLNDNLFEGATFADMRRTRGPGVWINASDIYNRTSFVFGPAAFAALCSDLAAYPLADAVAASAAVPVVFAPVVIKAYPHKCTDRLPEWIERVQRNPNTVPMLKAYADALARYHNGSMSYVKLLDGGLVDNFGLWLHHRALAVRYAVWSADEAGGGQAAPCHRHHRGCRTRTFRRLGAHNRRTGWSGAHAGSGRHGNRRKRARELYCLQERHGGLARCAGALALCAVAGGASETGRTPGLELPRSALLRQPDWF